jgi:hypothetical protein
MNEYRRIQRMSRLCVEESAWLIVQYVSSAEHAPLFLDYLGFPFLSPPQ